MTKNISVVEAFIKGISNIKTKHLFVEQLPNGVLVIYSYGHHYPLSLKLIDDTFLINLDGYSKTTACHKGILKRLLNPKASVLYFHTYKLQEIIDKKLKTKLEVLGQQ